LRSEGSARSVARSIQRCKSRFAEYWRRSRPRNYSDGNFPWPLLRVGRRGPGGKEACTSAARAVPISSVARKAMPSARAVRPSRMVFSILVSVIISRRRMKSPEGGDSFLGRDKLRAPAFRGIPNKIHDGLFARSIIPGGQRILRVSGSCPTVLFDSLVKSRPHREERSLVDDDPVCLVTCLGKGGMGLRGRVLIRRGSGTAARALRLGMSVRCRLLL